MYSNDSSDEPREAKFSAGIDTLKDIFEIIKEIRKATVSVHSPDTKPGKAQHLKVKLIKQLFIRASPLLDPEHLKALKPQVDSIDIAWMPDYMGRPIYRKTGIPIPQNYYEAYDPLLEDKLDNIEYEIMLAMQDSGKYFMPYKEDDEGL